MHNIHTQICKQIDMHSMHTHTHTMGLFFFVKEILIFVLSKPIWLLVLIIILCKSMVHVSFFLLLSSCRKLSSKYPTSWMRAAEQGDKLLLVSSHPTPKNLLYLKKLKHQVELSKLRVAIQLRHKVHHQRKTASPVLLFFFFFNVS